MTQTYRICTMEAFEIWSNYKGNGDQDTERSERSSTSSKFRIFKGFRSKKVAIIRQWMRLLTYPSHLYTLNSLRSYHHRHQIDNDKLLPPFLEDTYDSSASFFNFSERY